LSKIDAMGLYQSSPSTAANYVDVKRFGAKGDGFHDDAPSINLAFRTVVDKGGIVYFPPGFYVVRSCIWVKSSSLPILVYGEGPISRIVGGFRDLSEPSGGSVFYSDGQLSNIIFRDFQIEPDISEGYRYGFNFGAGPSNCTIKDVTIYAAGLDAISLTSPSDIFLSRNLIYYSGHSGISISKGSFCVIRDNIIRDSNQLNAGYSGIELGDSTASRVYENESTGTLQAYGIVSSGANCTVMGNYFTGVTGSGSLSGSGLFSHHNQPTDDPSGGTGDDTESYFPGGWT